LISVYDYKTVIERGQKILFIRPNVNSFAVLFCKDSNYFGHTETISPHFSFFLLFFTQFALTLHKIAEN